MIKGIIQYQPCHHKNQQFIERICIKKRIPYKLTYLINDLKDPMFNIIWSPNTPDLDPDDYKDKVILFGPHFFMFPESVFIGPENDSKYSRCVYNCLSDWNLEVHKEMCSSRVKLITLPFGVDTEVYKPAGQLRTEVILYTKSRHSNDIEKVKNFLKIMNIEYHHLHYGGYNHNEYIQLLKRCKYMILLDAHESQGFAVQECLSTGVPIFCWNITRMSDEWVGNKFNYLDGIFKDKNLYATSVPYWDDRCGKIVYNYKDFYEQFTDFIYNLDCYNPRQFVLETLSDDVCWNRFEKIFLSLLGSTSVKM